MSRFMCALVVVAAVLGAAPAFAYQEEIIIIQIDVVVRGDEGDVIQVADVAVDQALVGATCVGTATIENNESEHPGNDYILSTGSTSVEIEDFERTAMQVTEMSSWLVLGERITVAIRLGSDGVASLAGDTVTVASICQPPTTTTTSTTLPEVSSTTTTTPPPVGGVSAGGGSAAAGGSRLLAAAGAAALAGAVALVLAARPLHRS